MYYKCPQCACETERENKIMVICPCCQIEMKPIGYFHNRITEVKVKQIEPIEKINEGIDDG